MVFRAGAAGRALIIKDRRTGQARRGRRENAYKCISDQKILQEQKKTSVKIISLPPQYYYSEGIRDHLRPAQKKA